MGDLLSVCRGRSEGTPYPPSSAPPVAPPAHEDAACAVDAGRHEHGQAPEPKRVETFDADEEAAANNEGGQVEAEGGQPVQPEPSPTPPPEQQAFVVKKEPAQPEQPKQSSMASEDKPNGGGGGGPPPRSFSITLDPSADDLAGSTSKPKVFQMKDGDLGVSSGDESDYDASNATRVNNAAALLGSPADDGNDSSQSAGSTRKGPPPMILYSPRSSPKSVASSSSESETESETESEAEDDDEDDEDEAPKPVAASASAAASGGGSDSDGEAPAARRSMPPSQSGDQLASNGLPDPSALASPETEPRKRRGFNLTISTSKEDTASPAGGKKKKKRPGALNLSLPMTKPTLIRTPTVETPRLFRDKTEDGRPKFNQYIALKTIGRGMFGKVKLVEDENTGWKYAMKIMSKSGLQRRRGFGGPNSWDMVKLEVAIMKKLFHENVVRLFEVIDDSEADKLLLVMEFVKCGAVMDAKIDSEPLDIALAHSYFRELISGLEYLHSQGVIHRDIKPENLLVTEDGHLKITDFGVASKFTGEDAQLHDTAGSAAFMAPEICRGDDDFSGKATDLWAAGVTLFMFVTGRPPWVRQGIHKLHEAIINDPIDLPDGMDEQLADLLTGMLRKEADARLQLEDIKKHPWITQNGKWPMPDLDESEIHKATINEADLSNALSTAEDKDKSGDDADDNSD